jgi:hypothetical protein
VCPHIYNDDKTHLFIDWRVGIFLKQFFFFFCLRTMHLIYIFILTNLTWFKNWQSDNLKRGCYNLKCEGFVQTDKSITPGKLFDQTSIISGLTVEVQMAILQVIIFKLYHFHYKKLVIIIRLFSLLTKNNLRQEQKFIWSDTQNSLLIFAGPKNKRLAYLYKWKRNWILSSIFILQYDICWSSGVGG